MASTGTLAAYFLAWQLLAGVVTAIAIVVTHSHHPALALAVLLLVLNPLIIHQVFFRQRDYAVWSGHGFLGPRRRVRIEVAGPARGVALQTLVLYWALGWRSFVMGVAVTALMSLLSNIGLSVALPSGLTEAVDIAVVFAAFQWFGRYPYGRTHLEARAL